MLCTVPDNECCATQGPLPPSVGLSANKTASGALALRAQNQTQAHRERITGKGTRTSLWRSIAWLMLGDVHLQRALPVLGLKGFFHGSQRRRSRSASKPTFVMKERKRLLGTYITQPGIKAESRTIQCLEEADHCLCSKRLRSSRQITAEHVANRLCDHPHRKELLSAPPLGRKLHSRTRYNIAAYRSERAESGAFASSTQRIKSAISSFIGSMALRVSAISSFAPPP